MTSLAQDFATQAFESCSALKAQIEVTTRCNYRCGHCYNFDRAVPGAKGHAGLATSEWKDIIRQVTDLGVIELTFTGGEATLRSDLTELIGYARALHLIVNLRTNGSLLNPKRLAEYADAGLQDLDVTLYGFSAESHDRFTGARGSFETTLQSLEYLKRHHPKLKTLVTIAMLAHNHHEHHLKSQLEGRLKMGIRSNIACHGRNELDMSAQQHQVPLDRHVELQPVQKDELVQLGSKSSGDAETFRCGCARTSFFINSEGLVTPCAEVPWEAGDLKSTSLQTIWNSSEVFETIRNLASHDWKTCNGCALTHVCKRRNCSAFKYNGNYTDADPQYGRLAYARFKAYGVPKPPCLEDETSAS